MSLKEKLSERKELKRIKAEAYKEEKERIAKEKKIEKEFTKALSKEQKKKC